MMIKPIFSTKACKTHSVAASLTLMLSVMVMSALPISAQSKGLSDLFDTASSGSKSQFLPVNEAFKVSARSDSAASKTVLAVDFAITPGHYVYRDKIKLTLPKGVSAAPLSFNQGVHYIDDPQFGRVPVFDQSSVTATTTLTTTSAAAIENAAITIQWQGCAKAGLCYPPENINTVVSVPSSKEAATTGQKTNNQPTSPQAANPKTADSNTQSRAAKSSTSREDDTTSQRSNAANVSGSESTTQLTAPRADAANAKTATTRSQSAKIAPLSEATDQSFASDVTNAAPDINSDASAKPEPTGTEGETLSATQSIPGATTKVAATDNVLNNAASPSAQSNPQLSTQTNQTTSDLSNGLINQDPFGLASHPWLAMGLLFLAGLGLAFTACVYPMIPIVANIVAHQHNPTALKGMLLTAGYALGVATAYGVLGAIIAVFGQALGIIGWLQNPIILLSFAAVFILLALYMLEAYSVRLPSRISNKLTRVSQSADSKLGSFGGSVVAGALSALVVSPCVSAPLFGALTAVSTIGNPLLGFAALFMLGFGLSAPLLLLGATQGNFMPKAGPWMVWVKQGFALLLFAVALLLIERVFMTTLMLLAWAGWFMVVAVWAWSWQGRGNMFTRGLALLTAGWAMTLIVGAAMGSVNSWRPLAVLNDEASVRPMISANVQDGAVEATANRAADTANSATQRMTTLAQLDDIVARTDNVLVDVTADWCVECRIMDQALFATPPAELAKWQVVKLDITETTDDSKAILARYRLFGPPALLYYQNGQLVAQQVGEIKRADFIATLTQLQ